MSTWPNIVRMGTIKIPLAMPSMPPNALAATETAKSHNMKAVSISVSSASGSRSAREPGHETDLVATVVEFLVIDRRMFGGVRNALDQEYWAAFANTQGSRHRRVSRDSFQTILRFHQRRVVLLLEEREDRLRLQIVFEDPLADLSWQPGFIEGQRSVVGQSHALNTYHRSSQADREMPSYRFARRNDLLVE